MRGSSSGSSSSSSSITIEIPAIPITEALLFVLCILLWRACALLKDIARNTAGGALVAKSTQQPMGQREAAVSPRSLPWARAPSAPNAAAPTAAGSPPSPLLPPPPIERFLRSSSTYFADSLLGHGDVDVNKFITACRHFATVLEKAGPFTMLSIRETHSNIAKIENTYLLDPDRFRSMMAMLEEECTSGMHGRGASVQALADPSAAIGLLWARRGLLFWVALFRPHVERYIKKLRAQGGDVLPAGMLDGNSTSAGVSSRASNASGTPTGERSHSPYPEGLMSFSAATASPLTGEARCASPMPTCSSPLVGVVGPGGASSPGAGAGTGSAVEAAAAAATELTEGVASLRNSVSGLGSQLMSGVISQTGYEESLRAYAESIEPYNGWLARNTFTLTARATPDWETFGLKIAPTAETLAEDVHAWSQSVAEVLRRMREMHERLDLEDTRKSL